MMGDWNVALAIVTLVFAAFLVYRFRPVIGGTHRVRGPSLAALREAKERATNAKDAKERAVALADAGDAASRGGNAVAAMGYYLRAMRSDPASVAIVDRAADGLARRPDALEAVLWRRLASGPWSGGDAEAAHAALRRLASLYAHGSLRNKTRSRALENAFAAVSSARSASAARDDG